MRSTLRTASVWLAWLVGTAAMAQTPGLTPLNDLGPGTYSGFQGGLYPGGANLPPLAHLDRAMEMAALVRPLDAGGALDLLHGAIGLVAVGMSNANQEFAVFERGEDAANDRNARIVLVDGAIGGQDATILADPAAAYWTSLSNRVTAQGLSAAQVQVAWLKEDIQGAVPPFPSDALALRGYLESIVQILHDRFPNLRLCYLSSRTYAGFGAGEPKAFDTGFAVKWLIEDQINGDPALNDGRLPGAIEAPLLLWGPYLWANGPSPRSDGLTWSAGDFEADHTHPSASGEQKVAGLLSAFFDSDPTCAAWWRRRNDAALVAVDAAQDAHVDAANPTSNFGSELRLSTQGGPLPLRTYLMFSAPATGTPVEAAKLSLRVPTDSQGGGLVAVVANTSWAEAGLTWANAPPAGGTVATLPQISRDGTFAAALTAAVNADPDGVLSFLLSTPAPALASYFSRDSGDAPRLVVTLPCGGALPGVPDTDGDGVSDPCDCAPADPASTGVPREVSNLRWTDAQSLSWDSGAGMWGSATAYDVMSGALDDIASLWPAPGDLCVALAAPNTGATDTTPAPASGTGRYFLVRARNGCGAGPFESTTSGRDRLSAACP